MAKLIKSLHPWMEEGIHCEHLHCRWHSQLNTIIKSTWFWLSLLHRKQNVVLKGLAPPTTTTCKQPKTKMATTTKKINEAVAPSKPSTSIISSWLWSCARSIDRGFRTAGGRTSYIPWRERVDRTLKMDKKWNSFHFFKVEGYVFCWGIQNKLSFQKNWLYNLFPPFVAINSIEKVGSMFYILPIP